jgi:tRNA pseudouridine65 synthase
MTEVAPILPIIYQDEYLIAVNKPSGLLVHRSMIDRHETQFAMQIVRDMIGQHVYTVHRLDKPTCGVLVFALSSEVARLLNEQFTAKTIQKTYHALLRGWTHDQHIDYALKEKLDKIADKHAQQDKPAQSAQTDMKVLQTYTYPEPVGRYPAARLSWVELNPATGRKHQLRRHMAHIRHPIMGDTTHGDGKQNKFMRQTFNYNHLALINSKMIFEHPITQQQLELSAPLSDDLTELLATLKPYQCE